MKRLRRGRAVGRGFAFACVLGALATGCGSATPGGATAAGAHRCDPSDLPACEAQIAQAITDQVDVRGLVEAYVAARADADEDDPWVSAYRALGGEGPNATMVVVGAAASRAPTLPAALARTVSVESMPAPSGLTTEVLWLALGEAAGARHIVVLAREAPVHVFPADRLAPFTGVVPHFVRGESDVARIADDVALSRALDGALGEASRFDYRKAAVHASRVDALIEGRDPFAEPVLRGRYGLMLLRNAGLTLDDTGLFSSSDDDDAPSPPAPSEPPPPAPTDTAYGDLLRVKLATDEKPVWKARRDNVLSAAPEDRHAALDALFAPPKTCGPPPVLPFEGRRDLMFGRRLATSLKPQRPGPVTAEPDPRLELDAWLRRYRAFVAAVKESGTVWTFAPSMVYERGDSAGISAGESATYRDVTELTLTHLRALTELEKSDPRRFQSLALLPLVYARGSLTDPELQKAVIDLTQAMVRDKLAAATDAAGVFDGALAGVMSGLTYPPAIQGAHFLALQGAFTAKLRGDMTSQTGWGTAGLYLADGLFRLMTQQNPDPAFSSTHITRALSDSGIPLPSLAALATAAVRYAMLGARGELSAQVFSGGPTTGVRPDRIAARDALRAAIAGLGEGDAPASEKLVDDVTDLSDGFVAAVAVAISEGNEEPEDTCTKDEGFDPSPKVERAFGKLRDVRRRILQSPGFQKGDGLWIRRARLLVTVISDVLDAVEQRGKGPTVFAVKEADVERAFSGALREWDEPALADALAGVYSMVRRIMSAQEGEMLGAVGGSDLQKMFRGLSRVLSDDGAPGHQATLIDALATAAVDSSADDAEDLEKLLLGYAETFYSEGKKDQADLMLFATMMVAIGAERQTPPKVLELGARHDSRIMWAVRFFDALLQLRQGRSPDPERFGAQVRTASAEMCGTASVDDILSVIGSVGQFRSGRRDDARRALDGVLNHAEERGLRVPNVGFNYEEKTASRVFQLSISLSYGGGGFVNNANTFQLGLGARSPGEPGGSLNIVEASADSQESIDQTARYYVHVAALASVFHYLEGDAARGSVAARRALEAVLQGLRLGERTLSVTPRVDWAADAAPALAIAAQLAGESGQMFLAGDLWTLVLATVDASSDDEAVDDILGDMPTPLMGIDDLSPVVKRAQRSLELVTVKLACTERRPPSGAYEQATCEDYPVGVSLRIADALPALPRLRRGAERGNASCQVFRAVDGFLSAAESGRYDPDAFLAAVDSLRAGGKTYDAAVLFTRHRPPVHCSPVIVKTARDLGREPSLGNALRVDLLSVALNCSTAKLDEAFLKDVATLDRETRKLANPFRAFRLLLFLADLSLREDRLDVLSTATADVGFLERWMAIDPTMATAAMAMHHAAAVSTADRPDLEPSAASYRLLCETFPPVERASMCKMIGQMRDPKNSAELKTKVGRQVLQDLVQKAATPPP